MQWTRQNVPQLFKQCEDSFTTHLYKLFLFYSVSTFQENGTTALLHKFYHLKYVNKTTAEQHGF